MRILTVARWYPSHDVRGRGSFVADLVDATVSAGVEARVVSFDRLLVRGRLENREACLIDARAAVGRVATPDSLFVVSRSRGATGVPVARVPVVRRPGAGDAPGLIEDYVEALRPFVARLMADWRPDVVHAHTGLPDGIAAAAVARELGIPVLVSEHASTIETELADPAALERYRSLLEPGVRLLAVSPSVAGRVARLLGVRADAIGVLPNPVDDSAFPAADPRGRDPDELLWVGALGEHKGIDVLLQSFAQLRRRRPTLHLRLVGGERMPGDLDRWRSVAADLGIADAVAFDGWLDRRGVATAMARARIFVHPSPSETFGVVAAEAILSGLPVAARRSGGVPWIVELSGGFGMVAEGDDATAFAAAIEGLLDAEPPVSADEARARLVAAVGRSAVGAATLERYEQAVIGHSTVRAAEALMPGNAAGGAVSTATQMRATPTSMSAAPAPFPRVLVATEREQSIARVAGLPDGLRQRVVLVVPAGTDATPAGDSPASAGKVTLVEAAPARYERPPKGRGPIAQLKRATWKPPLTADEELGVAVRAAIGQVDREREPHDVVALDAPAAVLIDRLDRRRIRLAPGSLRWLADRWDAGRPAELEPG